MRELDLFLETSLGKYLTMTLENKLRKNSRRGRKADIMTPSLERLRRSPSGSHSWLGSSFYKARTARQLATKATNGQAKLARDLESKNPKLKRRAKREERAP